MFASRTHNENAIYEQQTAAAAKPLNQGLKGLAPKTPANKKGFRVPLNDENAALGGGKTGGKGKQDGLFGEAKNGKAEKSAFLTPAGPRNRAPLGAKTTNAKTTSFLTPAQEKPSAKHTSPRLLRAKVTVQDAGPITADDDGDEPEIEYMAPREVPLPDHPDDWPHDREYPQFEGKNLTRGWWSEFGPPPKDDDEDDEFSDFEEKVKRIEELNEKKKLAEKAKKAASMAKKSGGVAMQKTAKAPLTSKPPQTLKSRSAASALSNPTKPTMTPSFATPTTAAKARLPSVLASKKSVTTSTSTMSSGNPRHTAAKAASNSTLGYSKGRAVSGAARTPLAGMFGGRVGDERVSPAKPATASLDELFGLQDLDLGDDVLGGLGSKGLGGLDEEEDELEEFQLDPIEL